MESLFLLAFGEEEFFIAFAMACSEAFFYKLIIGEARFELTTSSSSTAPLLTRQVLPLEGARLLGSRVADRDRSDARWAHC